MNSEDRLNVPCRLSVILATEAPAGVIFRRGPSKWVQIIKWGTDTDTFTPGQWFNGRIEENACGLSPDGTKLIYFAINYTNKDNVSWTAVSKVPYLTALAYFPQGYFILAGGGSFLSNNEVRLFLPTVPGPNDAFPQESRYPSDLKIIASRTEEEVTAYIHKWSGKHEKPHPTKPLCLLINRSPQTSKEHKFVVKEIDRNLEIPLEGAVWADWDQQGGLVYAKSGKLFRGEIIESGQIQSTEIADFNANKRERIQTPEWAKVW